MAAVDRNEGFEVDVHPERSGKTPGPFHVIRGMVGTPGSFRSQLASGASGSFSLKMTHTGLAFLTSMLLARILGAEGYGVYAYAISWVALLLIPGTMGLPLLLTREIARSRAGKEWRAFRGILRWADRVAVVASVSLAAVGGVMTWLARDKVDSQIATALFLAMALLPLLVFLRVREGTLRGIGRVVESQIPQMLVLPLLFLAFIGGAHLLPFAITGYIGVGIRVAATIGALLTAVYLTRLRLPTEVSTAGPDFHSRKWLPSAVTLLWGTVAVTSNYEISVVMVGSLTGAAPAGMFSVATRGAMVVTFVAMAVSAPLGPIVARLHSEGQWRDLQRVVMRSARVVLAGSVPFALGLILFGHWFLFLFGDEFTAATTALGILCLGQLGSAALGPAGTLLTMTGHERYAAIGVGVAAIITASLNLLLLPSLGIEGAAIATVVGLTSWKVILATVAYSKLGVNCTPFGSLRSALR
jgi:O-antigen/teichoic acid export membrane protein